MVHLFYELNGTLWHICWFRGHIYELMDVLAYVGMIWHTSDLLTYS